MSLGQFDKGPEDESPSLFVSSSPAVEQKLLRPHDAMDTRYAATSRFRTWASWSVPAVGMYCLLFSTDSIRCASGILSTVL